MTALNEQHLQPCNEHCSVLSQKEALKLLSQLCGWRIDKQTDVDQLKKVYKFKTFNSAMVFATKIADIADNENHHPCICIEWGQTSVSWWTHSISGLFVNDFIMAAKCDSIYDG